MTNGYKGCRRNYVPEMSPKTSSTLLFIESNMRKSSIEFTA